ncbi:MAG: hypothetical protein KDB61_02545 [Planctomycetes bacterium]|nr:hypothetical protein [Planctomycetota bacterium]
MVLGASAQAQTIDPFAAGARWTRGAGGPAAWMAEEVHFAGRDQFLWGQAGGVAPHMALMRSDSAGPLVDRREGPLTGAALVRRSAAGNRPDRVYSLLQTDPTASGLRDTDVYGFAPFDSSRNQDMAPVWSHPMGTAFSGEPFPKCNASGDRVVAAVWLSGQNAVQVDVLDGTSGALLSRGVWPGLALNALEVSKDGERIAIAAGLDLYVLDGQNQLLHHSMQMTTIPDLALSANGDRLVAGGMGGARLFEADASGYMEIDWIPAHVLGSRAQQSVSSRVDLSDDGGTLAVAQWSYTGGQETAFELWNLNTGVRTFRQVQAAGAGGLQNLPTGAHITADGRRAAFASWGNGVDPEVQLVDRDSAAVVAEFDLVGSAFDIDLDESGTRIAVAHKMTHAQMFHAQGAFALLDSGERELQALSAARPGHALHMAAGRSDAGIVLWLVGTPGPEVLVAGVSGTLLLDRSRVAVRASLADPNGAAQMTLNVPSNWSAHELPFAVQAAFRTQTGTVLTAELLEPISLE